ncbi:MAG: beta-glucanase precursor [Bacteroidetes bacterium B1(2017)]|nr:MAG: beta-glucanase precursor [Bacteroidetes bacterium B1(2017)]
MNKLLFALFTLVLFSCSKAETSPVLAAPSNLTIAATVYTDSSGNAEFEVNATNATSYDFDFGDGVFKSTTNKKLLYKYSKSGKYKVTVLAKNSAGYDSKTMDIEVTIKLVPYWSDEFGYTGVPDASKWGYDIGTGDNGWGNAEQQYYTDRSDNAFVSNGTLKIITKAESFGGKSYTSARLLTKDKFAFQYGKVEVRAKLPVGVGTWPAIWMLGSNIGSAGWPACGEIDIMEHRGSELNKIFYTLHYPGHSGSNGTGKTSIIPFVTSEFHVYSIEWNASSIQFFVDGVNQYTFPNNTTIPFNHDFFIILNTAMGGYFGGTIDPAFTTSTMEIDYVRVYK